MPQIDKVNPVRNLCKDSNPTDVSKEREKPYLFLLKEKVSNGVNNPKLLLHACCAPCASHPAAELKRVFDINLVFYGSNIHPEEEYRKRLNSALALAERLKLELVELEYDPDTWFSAVKGLEKEPEGGRRCRECHRIRLKRIAEFAKQNGYEHFATTLTTSPHKPACIINPIGKEIAKAHGLDFLDKDFKEHDGFKKSCELSKEYGLYRQDYCGCIYSRRQICPT